jgi:hypothetical protein
MYILNTASKSKQELYTFGLFLIVTIEDDNITMQSSIMHYTPKYGNNYIRMCSYRSVQITAELPSVFQFKHTKDRILQLESAHRLLDM